MKESYENEVTVLTFEIVIIKKKRINPQTPPTSLCHKLIADVMDNVFIIKYIIMKLVRISVPVVPCSSL